MKPGPVWTGFFYFAASLLGCCFYGTLSWSYFSQPAATAHSRVKLSLALTHAGLFVACLFIIQAALKRNGAISLHVLAGLISGLTTAASMLIL